ncbi:hypothetical protein [Streptomyces avermitilis]|uniref:Uncharacterized protein n=1 Tax=Streptomyces avermitilis TaxID=33903 RepID=A0A4D4MAM5_STRAX|nr:hypothetical protein [Streptomyces avermitilis]GDY68507.1 hypothetical protein SAV14893_079000 [Streptomyces avermitilis]GDY71118.1 hypothetical protein SAV31267_006030 [Streptomyces avermitilis]
MDADVSKATVYRHVGLLADGGLWPWRANNGCAVPLNAAIAYIATVR